MSQIMIMYKNHNQTRALNIDGAEQIFLSIIQSPSFIIHDNSAVTVVLVSGAMLLFSPYMYIFSLEGATVAYFTSVLAGLDTDALSRQQHCVTGKHVTSLCIILIQNYYLYWTCASMIFIAPCVRNDDKLHLVCVPGALPWITHCW